VQVSALLQSEYIGAREITTADAKATNVKMVSGHNGEVDAYLSEPGCLIKQYRQYAMSM
jgi:hypothetical protein